MAKVIFVTGGVHSGKARWAVNYFGSMDYVLYMCMYEQLEKETADRIAFNCNKNGNSWNIQENANGLCDMVKGHKFAILDNLAEYTNRAIKEKGVDLNNITREQRKEIEKQVIEEITELIWEVKEVNGILLVLSVELGLCPVPSDAAQGTYRKMLGTINQRIANQAHEVYLLISGIHMKIK